LDGLVRLIEQQSPRMIGSILLAEDQGRRLRHGAGPNLPEEYRRAVDGVPIGPQVGPCGTAPYPPPPVIVAAIASAPLWADCRRLALPHGLRACWSAPILAAGGELLGTFAMYYREVREPDAHDWQLIGSATHLAAIAVEHHQAVEALHASERR